MEPKAVEQRVRTEYPCGMRTVMSLKRHCMRDCAAMGWEKSTVAFPRTSVRSGLCASRRMLPLKKARVPPPSSRRKRFRPKLPVSRKTPLSSRRMAMAMVQPENSSRKKILTSRAMPTRMQ